MKRLWFPYTSIEPGLAEALQASLGPLTLFHPLPEAVNEQTQKLAQAQVIELVLPCAGDAPRLMGTLEDFRTWAAEHAGQDLSGLLGQGPGIPFFDAETTARIAAEARTGAVKAVETTPAERLQRARLLLLLAQELDASDRELAADLRHLETQERRMLEALKGEDAIETALGGEGTLARPAATPPLHMLVPRIGAWAQLVLQAQVFWDANPQVLCLTDSPDVWAHVTEQVEAEPLLSEHGLTSASEDLAAWLTDPRGQPPLASTVPPPATTPPLWLTVCRLPQVSPREWLRQQGGVKLSPRPSDRASESSGVLVGHVMPG
jgi:hypothetical protein